MSQAERKNNIASIVEFAEREIAAVVSNIADTIAFALKEQKLKDEYAGEELRDVVLEAITEGIEGALDKVLE